MGNFNKLKSAQSLRRIPKGGPNKSDEINDSFEEILHDLAELFDFVNNKIIPVFNGLSTDGTYADFNPIAEGLDGKTILTDNSWTDTNNNFFYNIAQSRPKTIKETSVKLSQDVDQLFTSINTIQARLGAINNIETNNPATLTEIENQLNYFIGIVRTIQSNTTGYLTTSGIEAAIIAGTIAPTSWGIGRDDIDTNAAIKPTDISGVDLTAAFDYTTGEPATYDIADTIQRVKEFAEDTSGDSIVTFANSGLSGDSLKTHREKLGTGTASTTNPHGLDLSDLGDTTNLTTRITQVASFDIKISGIQDGTGSQIIYRGGYQYVPSAYTVTRVAGTAVNGGTTGLAVGIYRYKASDPDIGFGAGNVYIYSGLAITAAVPGTKTETGGFTNTSIVAGDLIFISGLSGDGQDARVFVWGTPA